MICAPVAQSWMYNRVRFDLNVALYPSLQSDLCASRTIRNDDREYNAEQHRFAYAHLNCRTMLVNMSRHPNFPMKLQILSQSVKHFVYVFKYIRVPVLLLDIFLMLTFGKTQIKWLVTLWNQNNTVKSNHLSKARSVAEVIFAMWSMFISNQISPPVSLFGLTLKESAIPVSSLKPRGPETSFMVITLVFSDLGERELTMADFFWGRPV